MKSYQLKYEDKSIFTNRLEHIRKECERSDYGQILFYISWKYEARYLVQSIAECIEKIFPDSVYYGNESSGNIYNGTLTLGVMVTCYIFEDTSTRARLVLVKENSEYSNLADLWKLCRAEKNLRAIELIPTISYLDILKIDNNEPGLSDDIIIFGGAGDDYDYSVSEAYIIAKGHDMTSEGMAVILYYGDNLNLQFNYVLGWKGLGRYMKITGSKGKIIYEIDGHTPISIYEKYLGINGDDGASLVFPLIVEEDGIEFIRTPQNLLPDNSMRMYAEISEGLMARIAYGDKNTILSSLFEKASEIATFRPQVLKAYSCGARRLFWGDDEIHKETLPLQDIAPISGFYTGGEILKFGRKLRVMNSTLVVISFKEGEGAPVQKNTDRFAKNDSSLISRITHFVEVVSEEQREALSLANEEKLRSDVVHDIIHSGKWSFIVNKNDEVIITDFSDEAKRIVNNNYTPGATDWTSIIHPDDKEAAYKAFRATIEDHTCNTPYDVTYRMCDRNGEYHWFHSAGRIVRDEDGVGEFFGIHIDITEQIEAQLVQKQQLEDALKMADSANHAKTEFLFNMSHDIRTPMNAVLGFTNMAIRHIDDKDKTLDCLHKIQQSGDLLLSLINSVLEVSRIESGKAVLDEQGGDIMCSFANIESTMRVMAEMKNIDLKFKFKNITDRYIFCDFGRCARIFVNIISNAIKYTGEGGKVLVTCEQIESATDGRAVYRYTFEDNGMGMSESFQKHVFEQFSRERSATITGIQGTGLGMAVCKSFVDLMGGTIECSSKSGEGTAFTVTLPFRLQDPDKCIDIYTRQMINPYIDDVYPVNVILEGKRVLLVEDNELNREIAISILEDEGLVVDAVGDGSLAVARMKEMGPDFYEYILMDVQMPVMNGYEATKAIRVMFPDVHIPIIALSANAFTEDRNASFKAGMDDHIAKPINVKELLRSLYRNAGTKNKA